MAFFRFETKDYNDTSSLASSYRAQTQNRDINTGALKPLKTTGAINPAPQKALTTLTLSQVMQGGALAKPEIAPYDAYNQVLSTSLSDMLGGQGEAQKMLGNQTALVPDDVLKAAGKKSAFGLNATSPGATGSGTVGSAAGGAGGGGVAKDEVTRRAKSWADLHLPYSQSQTREGYRMDCSGFVSMCWQLPVPGATTVTLASTYAHPITKEELTTGDILLNKAPGNSGHVVLFDMWANAEKTAYWAYDEAGSTGCSYHQITSYPYYGRSGYEPYRKN